MSKRKFGIDSDDHMSMFLSSITGDQVAALQHVQERLPTDLKCLAPLLEGFRKADEAAAPPPKTPVKIRHKNTARFTATGFTFRLVKQQRLRVSEGC
jgi:hypothetical protein